MRKSLALLFLLVIPVALAQTLDDLSFALNEIQIGSTEEALASLIEFLGVDTLEFILAFGILFGFTYLAFSLSDQITRNDSAKAAAGVISALIGFGGAVYVHIENIVFLPWLGTFGIVIGVAAAIMLVGRLLKDLVGGTAAATGAKLGWGHAAGLLFAAGIIVTWIGSSIGVMLMGAASIIFLFMIIGWVASIGIGDIKSHSGAVRGLERTLYDEDREIRRTANTSREVEALAKKAAKALAEGNTREGEHLIKKTYIKAKNLKGGIPLEKLLLKEAEIAKKTHDPIAQKAVQNKIALAKQIVVVEGQLLDEIAPIAEEIVDFARLIKQPLPEKIPVAEAVTVRKKRIPLAETVKVKRRRKKQIAESEIKRKKLTYIIEKLDNMPAITKKMQKASRQIYLLTEAEKKQEKLKPRGLVPKSLKRVGRVEAKPEVTPLGVRELSKRKRGLPTGVEVKIPPVKKPLTLIEKRPKYIKKIETLESRRRRLDKYILTDLLEELKLAKSILNLEEKYLEKTPSGLYHISENAPENIKEHWRERPKYPVTEEIITQAKRLTLVLTRLIKQINEYEKLPTLKEKEAYIKDIQKRLSDINLYQLQPQSISGAKYPPLRKLISNYSTLRKLNKQLGKLRTKVLHTTRETKEVLKLIREEEKLAKSAK
jgi:hypothetical protein